MKSSRSAARLAVGMAGLIGAAALLTACASATNAPAPAKTVTITATPPDSTIPPGSSSAPAPGGTAGSAPSQPTCPASALQPSLSTSNGAAGTIYQAVLLTNTSSQTCALDGFPGVSFVTRPHGRQLGAPATRSDVLAPVSVVLQPGKAAQMVVGVAQAGNFPPAKCHPTEANWLRIFAPGDFGALYLRYSTQACGSPSLSILTVTVVRPAA
jgi:hypothetical protein